MKLSICRSCGEMLHFENTACLDCGTPLGFLPGDLYLTTASVHDDGVEPASRPGERWRACANAEDGGCNWLIPPDSESAYCAACEFNRTIPDLSVARNRELWRLVESAKRRLIYSLLRFGLPIVGWREDPERGLAFDFLADTETETVYTGHAGGLITINIAEADSIERERRRVALCEPMRTMLGHMRHEIAHYYFDMIVAAEPGRLEASRRIFGDERESYGEALKRYYRDGPPEDWRARHVSEYATAHPWEDFAESWTHYLHTVDTLDTAASFGLAVGPSVSPIPRFAAAIPDDPYRAAFLVELMQPWKPVATAVNGLNRSIGQPDLYPFTLSPIAVEKLGVIHMLIHASASGRA